MTLCGLGTGTQPGWPGKLSPRTHVQHKVAMGMLVETWGPLSEDCLANGVLNLGKKIHALDQKWACTETEAHGINNYSVR